MAADKVKVTIYMPPQLADDFAVECRLRGWRPSAGVVHMWARAQANGVPPVVPQEEGGDMTVLKATVDRALAAELRLLAQERHWTIAQAARILIRLYLNREGVHPKGPA